MSITQRDASADQIAWVVTANLVATAVVTPLAGWLAARFGARRLCLVSVIGFAIACAGCGMAGSLEALVGWRALQGAFGAPLVPLSQAIVLDGEPRERHGTVIAYLSGSKDLDKLLVTTEAPVLTPAEG